MASHYEINPDEYGLALRVAQRALRIANGLSTARPGNVFIPNKDENGMSDGTGTWIGSGAVGNGGVAPWVGDTTPPGKPTGVSATSAWGTVYAKWDGTLEGGVPEDFAYVEVAIDDVVFGRITEAGTVAVDGYENGHEATVTFVAYDAARDRTGALSPNASEAATVTLTVVDERDAIDADVEEAKQQAQAAADAADAAAEKADSFQQQITDVTTTVNGIEQDVTELSTQVSGAVEDASQALTAASSAQQDLEGFKTTVSQTYETKADADAAMAQEVLDRNSAIEQSASEITQTVSETYQVKGDYATGDELDNAISQEVLDRNSAIEQSATQITQTVSQTYTTKTEASAIEDKADAALESAQGTASDLTDFAQQVTGDLTDLQSQIDGSIQTWFYDGVPTMSNAPANQWTTDAERANHLGDLYYDLDTGYAYRFMQQNSVYSWSRLADSDVTEALQNAAAAQDTADSKRRIFVTQPTPPYDVGDLWVQGSTGDILRCLTAKTASQSYASADWVLASKYTDDSMAESVQGDLDDYKQTVSNTYATQSSLTQTANQIRGEVSQTYVTKTDAEEDYQPKGDYLTDAEASATYATQSSVAQTADSIRQEVSETYQTRDGMSAYATKSYVDQQDDSITSSVSKVQTTADNAYELASTVQQTASGLEVRLTKAESDVDAAQEAADEAASAASAAQTTANSASSAASSAQSAASTASDKADAAQSTANTANSTANTALSTANSAQDAAEDAAKVATNYLGFSSGGLVVGTNSSGTGQSGLQGNVRLTGDGMEVRSGSTVLASYGANEVSLGKNSENSTLLMCGERGTVEYITDPNQPSADRKIFRMRSSANNGVVIENNYSDSLVANVTLEQGSVILKGDNIVADPYANPSISSTIYHSMKTLDTLLEWAEVANNDGLNNGATAFRQLWSGTWSSGSITVPNLTFYRLFAVSFGANNLPVGIGIRGPNASYITFFCVSGSSYGPQLKGVMTTASGNTLTMNRNSTCLASSTGNIPDGGATTNTIRTIWGIL